jgi:hypothetical protein
MSIALDPIVSQKLRQFARRRMWLIVARGICAGLVTFLLCLAIVAAIDWYWLLSDQGLGTQRGDLSAGRGRRLDDVCAKNDAPSRERRDRITG